MWRISCVFEVAGAFLGCEGAQCVADFVLEDITGSRCELLQKNYSDITPTDLDGFKIYSSDDGLSVGKCILRPNVLDSTQIVGRGKNRTDQSAADR
jgi:hypothetical protein